MDLSFETRVEEPWTILSIRGELDLQTSTRLQEELKSATDGGAWLALDLSGVSFMDSSSLGVLVGCLKRVREDGGEMALVGLRGSPRKVIELTGLDSVFRIAPDVPSLFTA
jgi:anti-sigma B factor antagonist